MPATSLDKTLGNVCVACSNTPTKRSPKLATVNWNSEEGFYLLATYCFDLARKMKYLFDATKEFGADADPAFKARAFQATNDINSTSLTSWKQRAQLAEDLLHEMYDATADAYVGMGGQP
jgi:hypothetical protein